MPLYEKNNGQFVLMHPAVKVSGTWKNITDGWERTNGVWNKIYTRRQLKLSNMEFIETISATLNVYRNGTLDVRNHIPSIIYGPADEWVSDGAYPTIGDEYEYRMTLTPGYELAYTNALYATWAPLSQDLWWIAMLGVDFAGTLEIGLLGTSTALVTSQVHLQSLLEIPPF